MPLHRKFDLIFGTSTGSIIASMIALGEDIDTIRRRYFEIVADVMGQRFSSNKTRRLYVHGEDIYGSRTFHEFSTNIGIVTTDLEHNRPMVFKSGIGQAHGMASSFEPGFGCRISDAVIASSAAYPFFKKAKLETSAGSKILVDGGFSANNPALLALTDAVGSIGVHHSRIRLLTVGTGSYPIKKHLIQRWTLIETITTLLGTNANTIDGLRKLIFKDVAAVRVDGAFTAERYRTTFLESDVSVLDLIFQLGRRSFGDQERAIIELLS